jgi:hypothetical protein
MTDNNKKRHTLKEKHAYVPAVTMVCCTGKPTTERSQIQLLMESWMSVYDSIILLYHVFDL